MTSPKPTCWRGAVPGFNTVADLRGTGNAVIAAHRASTPPRRRNSAKQARIDEWVNQLTDAR
jgi:hypothetical protein